MRPLPGHLLGVRDARRSPVGRRACVRMRRRQDAVPRLQRFERRQPHRGCLPDFNAIRASMTDMGALVENSEVKMIDRYTKTTLTIIGLALLALAIQNGLQHASAQWNCGASPDNPCYLKVHLDCGGSTCPVRLER